MVCKEIESERLKDTDVDPVVFTEIRFKEN